MAVTPLPMQAQVKKHIQLILERLLHTVNRRVIVLERKNTLRVSATVTLCRTLGLCRCLLMQKPSLQPMPRGWGCVCGDSPQQMDREPKRDREPCPEQLWSRRCIGHFGST